MEKLGMIPKSKDDAKKWRTRHNPSVVRLLKFMEDNKSTVTNQNSGMTGSYDFTGTRSFDDALELLKNGSPDIMKGLKVAVKLESEKIKRELNTQPEGYVSDVEGLFFDVAKVIEGEPECWYREPWDKTRKPRLNVPIMGSYNAGFAKEKAIKHGAEIIALVKALENVGFEVSLHMVFLIEGASPDARFTVQSTTIKNYDETFNWAKLSAMLHPSFFRRFMFREIELMFPNNLNSGYGRTADPKSYFTNGGEFINIAKHDSIERFKASTFKQIRGAK